MKTVEEYTPSFFSKSMDGLYDAFDDDPNTIELVSAVIKNLRKIDDSSISTKFMGIRSGYKYNLRGFFLGSPDNKQWRIVKDELDCQVLILEEDYDAKRR